MQATTKLRLFILFLFLLIIHFSFSQTSPFPISEWEKKLEDKNDIDNKGIEEIVNSLDQKKDAIYGALSQMEQYPSSNHYYRARFLILKLHAIYNYGLGNKSEAKQYCEEALKEAYETGDDCLISFICTCNGSFMGLSQEIELSATYYISADEINQDLQRKPRTNTSLWISLGETLFHTREYEKCIEYLKKGIYAWIDTSAAADFFKTRYWNTVGQAYKQLGQLDSALLSYERSMQLSEKLNLSIWKGINSVFTGEVYFLKKDYGKAKHLIQDEYKVKYWDERNVSAYALQLLARINLVQGEKDSALSHIRESLLLLRNSYDFPVQKMNYFQLTYYVAADVFRELGNTDSFYHYNQLYAALHDSLERIATLSSIKAAQARIDNERNHYAVLLLQREKKAEELKRNFIIAAIVLLSIIVFFYVNRQRLKHRHKEQLALQEKEAEIAAAKEQLKLFTENILDKTTLIEKLEQQVQYKQINVEQHRMIDELSQLTILTEDDWQKFKNIFDKIYPGFFMSLREKARDITVAEQRMAALTRLHLTTKQIASILGISVDSVHKTRQRLRQRLNLTTDINLEETVAEF